MDRIHNTTNALYYFLSVGLEGCVCCVPVALMKMDDLSSTMAQWLKRNYWLYGKEKRPDIRNLKTKTLCFLMIPNDLNMHWNENHSISPLLYLECFIEFNSYFFHTFFEMNNKSLKL